MAITIQRKLSITRQNYAHYKGPWDFNILN